MKRISTLHTFVLLIFLAGGAAGQSAADGLRLYGSNNATTAHLVDLNNILVHTWTSSYMPGQGLRLLSDGRLLRTARIAGGPNIGGVGGAVQILRHDSTVEWEYHYHTPQHWSHHDAEMLPNGNVLLIAWENATVAQATAFGRNPALITGTVVRTDTVIEVQPTGPTTGTIVWEWHVKDHLVQDFSAAAANFGVVAQHPELVDINFPATAGQAGDINHMNAVTYNAQHDWVIMSSHNQSEVWIIDHSTTTAQAASHSGGVRGRGGDLLYRWGNPQAYDAGSAATQQLYGQHNPRIIPAGRPGAGNLTVFNNNFPGGSRAWELALPADSNGNFAMPAPGTAFGPSGPLWSYSALGFSSTNISGCERLPNGNTLICSGAQGRLFEVTPTGATVWNNQPGGTIFHAHFVDRALWASGPSLVLSTGGSIQFHLITGSQHANENYILLASASGTTPGIALGTMVLPLNQDDLLVYSLLNANTPLLTSTLGVLNASGKATASLNLPPLVGLPGALQLHFAAVCFTGVPTLASVAVPVTILP